MTKSVSVNNKPTVEIDSTTPVDVSVDGNLSIDSSTPIDVNVTNTSIDTNATIQGTPSVTVSGDVGIDDATAIRVDVTNTEVDVNVTNAFQYIYAMVYDGSQWRFQASDANGKTISLDRTYYTSSDITAMSSSNDINIWLAAHNDNMLTKKYVESYDGEFEQDVYLQHPDLTSGNCLQLIYQYSTENTQKVVKSVWAKIATWTFDDDITGSVSVAIAGSVTSPDPSSVIPIGTDICTLTVTETVIGDITVSLTGANASLYRLSDGVNTGSSITYNASNTPLVVESASDFSGANYSHSLSAVITSDKFGITDTVNITTSGTYTATPAYANLQALQGSDRTDQSTDFQINVTGQSTTEKSLWPSLGAGTNYMPSVNDDLAVAFWIKPSGYIGSGRNCVFYQSSATGASSNFIACYVYKSSNDLRFEFFYGKAGTALKGRQYSITYVEDQWTHIVISKGAGVPSASNVAFHINGGSAAGSTGISVGSMSTTDFDSTTVNNLEFFTYPRWLGTSYNRNESTPMIDEFYAINRSLTQSEVAEFLDSSNNPVDSSDLTFSSNIDSHFRFGDLTEDSVANNQSYDRLDTNRYLEKVGTHNGSIKALSLNDDVYYPGSTGNLKFVHMPSSSTVNGDFYLVTTGSEKSLWPSLGTGTNYFPQNSDAWTISCWVKGNQNTSSYLNIVSLINSNAAQIKLFINTGALRFSYNRDANNGQMFFTTTGSSVLNGAWNNIIITKASSTNIPLSAFTLYINGNLVSGYTSSDDSYGTSTGHEARTISSVQIGGALVSAVSGNYLTRSAIALSCDEFLFLNKELSTNNNGVNEIAELYNGGATVDPSDLSFSTNVDSYFRMGDHADDDDVNVTFVDNEDTIREFQKKHTGSQAINNH